MPTIIRLKENETTAQMFEILQSTLYSGLDKTEIIRAILAEKVWSIKTQISLNNATLGLTSQTKTKLKKAYQSHKEGKSISVKNSDIENFLENLVVR
ncbi:MAG: hypothetical protein WCK98_04955 [bacterium]